MLYVHNTIIVLNVFFFLFFLVLFCLFSRVSLEFWLVTYDSESLH